MKTKLGCLLLATSTTWGCAVDTLDSESTVRLKDQELIGGRTVGAAEFPSATAFWSGCTAAKVGPRHFITVGHCVLKGDGTINERFQAGAENWVISDNTISNWVPPWIPITIEQTYLHPQWQAACDEELMQNPECGVLVLSPSTPPDVAVVVIEELTPSIAEAAIDLAPVEVGDMVDVLGYGCTQPDNSGGGTLKTERLTALPESSLNHASPWPYDAAAVYDSYVITPGVSSGSQYASLCSGDSGGPIYRAATSQALVVGVNAYYSFSPSGGASVTNWHTRLGTSSTWDVDGWLESIDGLNLENTSTDPDPGGDTPCAGVCSNPVVYGSASFQSGNLGTGASCFETTATLQNFVCGGFVSPRTLTINGTSFPCTGGGYTLPAAQNGGYCLEVSAGDNAWSWFNTW